MDWVPGSSVGEPYVEPCAEPCANRGSPVFGRERKLIVYQGVIDIRAKGSLRLTSLLWHRYGLRSV